MLTIGCPRVLLQCRIGVGRGLTLPGRRIWNGRKGGEAELVLRDVGKLADGGSDAEEDSDEDSDYSSDYSSTDSEDDENSENYQACRQVFEYIDTDKSELIELDEILDSWQQLAQVRSDSLIREHAH